MDGAGPRGRRPLPLERPRGGREQFAWLSRAIRTYLLEHEVRRTSSFTERINGHLHRPMQPESVNRLENAQLDFDIERVRAYERVLDVEVDHLIDIYIHLVRLDGIAPRWRADGPAGRSSPADFDLLHRVARDEPLPAGEWLTLSHAVGTRRTEVLDSSRFRDSFGHGLLAEFGRSFERDERLLREAIINAGDAVVPYVLEYARSAPITHFNAVEALGYMSSHAACRLRWSTSRSQPWIPSWCRPCWSPSVVASGPNRAGSPICSTGPPT